MTRRPADRPQIPSIRLLQATTFVSTLDRFAMPPMLVAIAADLGTSLAFMVQAAGAYFLAYGLMQPVWGMVSDRLGLVRTMRLTLLMAALATTSAAFATTPMVLALTRGSAGAFFGAAYPSSLIYLGDTVPPTRRQGEITKLMVGVALGTSMGSVGAGVLAHLVSWRLAFLVTGLGALLLVGLLRGLPTPTEQRVHGNPWQPIVAVLTSRTAVLVLLLALVEGAVLLGALTMLPAAIESTGESASVAGLVTAVYGLAVFVAATLVGRLSRRHHPTLLITLGAAAAVLGCAVAALSTDPGPAALAAVLLGLAWAGMHSSLQTWATEVLPGARATLVSLFAGALFIGSASGAVLASELADAGRYGLIYAIGALMAVPLGAVAAVARWRWDRPQPAVG